MAAMEGRVSRRTAWMCVAVVCFLCPSVDGANYQVGSVSCSATGQTSVNIQWTLPGNAAGDLTGYVVTVTRNDGLATENYPPQPRNGQNTLSMSWSGLSIYGGYLISVTCVSNVTPTQTPTTTTCTTDPGIPLVAPPNVTATPTSYNAMDITWNDLPAISKRGVIQGTLAGPVANKTENETVYYCYQLIPGTFEFESAGKEMSCIPYAAVMLISGCLSGILLLLVICLCCCGGGGGGGGGGDTVVVIEKEDPPCYSPEPPASILTARDVHFDDENEGWASPSGKSRAPADTAEKVPPVIIEEEEDW